MQRLSEAEWSYVLELGMFIRHIWSVFAEQTKCARSLRTPHKESCPNITLEIRNGLASDHESFSFHKFLEVFFSLIFQKLHQISMTQFEKFTAPQRFSSANNLKWNSELFWSFVRIFPASILIACYQQKKQKLIRIVNFISATSMASKTANCIESFWLAMFGLSNLPFIPRS